MAISCVSEPNNSFNILPTLPQIYNIYSYSCIHIYIHIYLIIKIQRNNYEINCILMPFKMSLVLLIPLSVYPSLHLPVLVPCLTHVSFSPLFNYLSFKLTKRY